MPEVRNVSPAETARILKKRLKREFPDVKFSVRSQSYSGGTSIAVAWTNGPIQPDVDAIARQYAGAGFDPSIDLKYYREHWLMPDGTTTVRYCAGTQGSKGTIATVDNPAPDDAAEAVRFGVDFIHTYRSMPDWESQHCDAIQWLYRHCRIDQQGKEPDAGRDMMGQQFVTNPARRLVNSQREGEDLENTYRRLNNLPPAEASKCREEEAC